MAGTRRQQSRIFEAAFDLRLPELTDVVAGGRSTVSTTAGDRVYFDTDHRDLAAHGVTLQSRSGDEHGWLLSTARGPVLKVDGPVQGAEASGVPAELAGLVAGVRRGRALRHAASVHHHCTRHEVTDPAGAVAVVVSDERIDTVGPGRRAAAIHGRRIIRVEPGPTGSGDAVKATARALRRAGATRIEQPPAVPAVLTGTAGSSDAHGGTGTGSGSGKAKRRVTAGDVIGGYLREQDTALLQGDLALRQGGDAIHPTRVATRRLRSTLRVYAGYFDNERAAAFDRELAWYASVLGEVRDREVQRARFAALLADLPDELVLGPVAAHIEQTLLAEQLHHQQALEKVMAGRRYLALLQESGRWVTDTPFTARADRKAAALLDEVHAAGRKVVTHLDAGLGSGDDEELHKARKAGKRARYAVELAHDLVRKPDPAITRFKDLQDLLGDHQDGAVATALLRRLGAGTAGHPDQNGFTYGLLYAHEQQRADRSRDAARTWTPPKL